MLVLIGRLAQELKEIMAAYGGRFEMYYSRQIVTHIICSNLPDSKVKHFHKERSGPNWQYLAPAGLHCLGNRPSAT